MVRNRPRSENPYPEPRNPKGVNQFPPGGIRDHDEDVARLHAEGLGRNDIVRELGLTNHLVTQSAKRQGLKFDGSQVLMATEVRRREAQERRAILSLQLLDDAEALRERLFSPMTYVQYGGKDFVRVEDTPEQPVPHDQAALVRGIGMLLDRAIKLDEYDKAGTTLEDAYNFLDGVEIVIRGTAQPSVDGQAREALEAADDARQD